MGDTIYTSKLGIPLTAGFYWVQYANDNLLSIVAIDPDQGDAVLTGVVEMGKPNPISLNDFIKLEQLDVVTILERINKPE